LLCFWGVLQYMVDFLGVYENGKYRGYLS